MQTIHPYSETLSEPYVFLIAGVYDFLFVPVPLHPKIENVTRHNTGQLLLNHFPHPLPIRISELAIPSYHNNLITAAWIYKLPIKLQFKVLEFVP